MLAVANRLQNLQRAPIFVDNIYNRLRPIQAHPVHSSAIQQVTMDNKPPLRGLVHVAIVHSSSAYSTV